jgi:hypothetical protein
MNLGEIKLLAQFHTERNNTVGGALSLLFASKAVAICERDQRIFGKIRFTFRSFACVHSWRKASMGATFAARHAGMQLAASVTTSVERSEDSLHVYPADGQEAWNSLPRRDPPTRRNSGLHLCEPSARHCHLSQRLLRNISWASCQSRVKVDSLWRLPALSR